MEILNRRFIVKQVPEQMDQVCKAGLNRCNMGFILDPSVKLFLLESLRPILSLLRPGYAILHFPPRQFVVNLIII